MSHKEKRHPMRDFPGGSVVKNPLANAGDASDLSLILGQEDPLEKEMANHSNILAWKIPWTEEPGGRAIVHGVTKIQIQLSN